MVRAAVVVAVLSIGIILSHLIFPRKKKPGNGIVDAIGNTPLIDATGCEARDTSPSSNSSGSNKVPDTLNVPIGIPRSAEVSQKQKILPPLPSSTRITQGHTINLASSATGNRTTEPTPARASSSSSTSRALPPPPSTKPVSSPLHSSSSSSLSSSTKPLPTNKPILSLASSNGITSQAKKQYVCVWKDALPVYAIPEDFKDLIRRERVPGVLKRPLSPSSYKEYFEALLYAEDFYIEKWDGFEMKKVILKVQEAEIYKRKHKHYNRNVSYDKEDKVFVEFELNSIPEKCPFLLSRDFVSACPCDKDPEDTTFQGVIFRVKNSNLVLVEFGDDFHSQHCSTCVYNVKFSFNRVCLKRAHQAIAAVTDRLFMNFLFPECIASKNAAVRLKPFKSFNPKLDLKQVSAVRLMLSNQFSLPYLVEGPLSVNQKNQLSRTGDVVCEAVLQIYQNSSSRRILICAPTNNTCDILIRNLKKEIPESDMFRANAAFRELDGVPLDILPSCRYKGECFCCPSIRELRTFKVILSTFMSCFRLHNEGIMAGHFSHIFLVDASSATEPETMVALASLADDSTAVIVTGAPRNHSGWIRSQIARENGLMISYFERLRNSKLYGSLEPEVITVLGHQEQKAEMLSSVSLS